MLKSSFLVFFLSFLLCTTVYAQYAWKSVQFIGGGYVPGITFHPNGDGYIRTDVGGAYCLNADGSWTPLNDAFLDGNDMGSVAIFADEGNPNLLYTTGGLYPVLGWCGGGSFFRSSNKGQTWEKIPLTSSNVSGTTAAALNGDGNLCLNGNWEGRGTGNRLAANGNTIYFATNQNGLLKSTDRGTSWTVLTVASVARESGFTAVFTDKNNNVYASPNGGGLYRSTNAGTSWTQVSGITGTVYQMAYSSMADVAFITTNTGNTLDQGTATGGRLWRLNTANATVSEITNLSQGTRGLVGLAISLDASEVAVATSSTWNGNNPDNNWNTMIPHGYIYYTTDGGSSWRDILKTGTFDASSAGYVNASNPHWVSALGIDPKKPGRIIFGTGFGMLSTEDASVAQPAWKFASNGIEETVPLGIVSTTKGAALVSVLGDVDGAYHVELDSPPADRHRRSSGDAVGTIYDLDYAGLNPNFMVMIHKQNAHNFGAYSTDGGKTWVDFGSNPSGINNQIETNFVAVSADTRRIVWNITGQGIYSSSDSGKTWQQVSGTSSFSGFRIVSDKVAPNTFYAYIPNTGTLHRSVNGSAWNSINTQLARSTDGDWAWGFFRMFASPFREGELWATQGAQIPDVMWLSGDEIGGVQRSTDGGVSFSKVSGIEFARYIGFGKGLVEANPAVYFTGMAQTGQTVASVYRSVNYSTWTPIDNAANKYGEVTMVVGDPCIYSRVYLGTSGRGIIYGEEDGHENTCSDREDYDYVTPVLKAPENKKAAEGIRLYFDGTRIKIQKTLQNGETKSFDLKGGKRF
ncbi:MAG: hypothetical protein LBC85_08265 [Fibromonadaceae bacterium]|jgi:hypothetical protein|nr:hypothetical protein [Fibromonadaceae bacterium]